MSDFDAARRDLSGLRDLGQRARYDAGNRRALLAVHVAFGVAIAGCFALYGVPIGWRTSLGDSGFTLWVITTAPAAGAGLLAIGMVWHHLYLEAAGMSTMLGWEVLGVAVVLRWIHLADPGPLQYQVALYATPAALMVVHLVTLLVNIRDQRRRGVAT